MGRPLYPDPSTLGHITPEVRRGNFEAPEALWCTVRFTNHSMYLKALAPLRIESLGCTLSLAAAAAAAGPSVLSTVDLKDKLCPAPPTHSNTYPPPFSLLPLLISFSLPCLLHTRWLPLQCRTDPAQLRKAVLCCAEAGARSIWCGP